MGLGLGVARGGDKTIEYGNVAYQIVGDDEYNRIHLGCAKKRSNII